VKSKLSISLLLILLFTSIINITAQDSYNLKYNFEKGASYKYKLAMNIKLGMALMEQGGDIDIDLKALFKIDVKDVTADTYSLLCTGDSLVINSPIINSDSEPKSFKIELKLDKNGKVLEQKLVEGSPEITAVDFKQVTSFFTLFPGHPVKIGDTWSAEDSINSPQTGNAISKPVAETKFKVEGKEILDGNECLKISYVQDIKSPENKPDSTNVFNAKGNLQGNGILYYDLKKGVLALNTMSAKTAAEVNTTGENKALSFSMDMKMEMKLVK